MYNVYLFFLPDVQLIELDGHSLSVENLMRIGRGELRVKVKKQPAVIVMYSIYNYTYIYIIILYRCIIYYSRLVVESDACILYVICSYLSLQ